VKEKKTLKEVAKKKGLDIKIIEDQFTTIPDNKSKEIEDFQNWDIDSLINYIVDTHHSYIKKTIPEITQVFCKTLNVHSTSNLKLDSIFKIYLSMSNDLTDHMTDEESILFPYINSLKNSKQFTIPKQSVLHGAINIMEFEHIALISYFAEIRELSRQYEIPTEACSSLKILYSSLNDLEEDLKEHIHLENNILFPKAMALEQQIINPF
jgi:regulator of cell morphogenesis and NO signaling